MTIPTNQTAPRHWAYSIPLLGWIAHDLVYGTRDNWFYFLIIVLTVLVVAMKTWGLVALGLTALASVPLVFALLVALTLGN